MSSPTVLPRVAAMLAAYEARSIDAMELHGRLHRALRASEPTDAPLAELANAVDEAMDLGRGNEREDIAWATARFWRRTVDGS